MNNYKAGVEGSNVANCEKFFNISQYIRAEKLPDIQYKNSCSISNTASIGLSVPFNTQLFRHTLKDSQDTHTMHKLTRKKRQT